ncbi:lysozyme inhibitor LprI family protein [Terribacillus sp. 179-K 1B1 HS]|uniref:lysozyme inhibitor LprI family protein n=1 Tax=Terribacillus sp. 179-K 1B1 HS TaxID=3142388 RepID=UPI0039A3C848
MNSKRKLLIGMCTTGLLLLAACGNASDESTAASTNADSAENDLRADTDEKGDSNTNTDTEDKGNNDTYTDANNTSSNDANEKVNNDSNSDKKEDDASTGSTASLKEEYLDKLNAASTETEESRNNPADSSTYAMKNVEGNNYTVWDGLLNEIYQVLENQLTAEDMEHLRQEQQKWIDYRDNSAKEASLKYEGGTMENLEYTSVLVNLTEDRCFELVENYMK